MIESNEGYVVNYFIHGETNALAEGINSKIQKFISSNHGTRDKDFFSLGSQIVLPSTSK